MADPTKKHKDFSIEAQTAISSAWDQGRVRTVHHRIELTSLGGTLLFAEGKQMERRS